MAYQRSYGYQYETSPKKLQPDYEPNIRKREYKRSSTVKKINKNENTKAIQNQKQKAKLVLYVVIAFAILLGISYRNSLIAEKFNKKEELNTQLSSIKKENEQLKVNIESSLNLNNVEQIAKDKLGMKKLDNSQKIYINLPKKDYIEAPAEEVKIKEDQSFWQKLWKGITEGIK